MGNCCFKPSKRQFSEYKREYLCRRILEKHYKKHFPSCRPDFLKNPKTKRNLELDGYNKKLKLAFEYNGIQHYKFTPKFHKSIQDLEKQQERDRLKQQLCKKHGIKLIVVSYKILDKDLKKYLLKK